MNFMVFVFSVMHIDNVLLRNNEKKNVVNDLFYLGKWIFSPFNGFISASLIRLILSGLAFFV